MKKLLLLLLAALGGSMSASAQFSLSGRIDGMPDSLRVTVVNVENPDKATLLCETAPKAGRSPSRATVSCDPRCASCA